ncbi:MAG: DUF262 domain-containing protein [Salinivirgaceae bacterium]|jgi:hypothetical protein|nr:DUF262 domain-containing protein [Bacteroidota bacterium]MCB9330915.1 DUF262 domain-containing protein [Lewinellaceae bacterium]HMU99382.1 DUF262 domain-containing HNH endonuclease family protein [Chitinophagales bacterium]MCB0539307.1 DUF262 domain-containing protein [Bacteroidota bacterium]HNJ60310.1 DUF262 domain-containing HNH endonuclease family protein [Chitinophagales bacterium]
MEKKTLSNILEGKIFQIPDYQRGYAWEEKQWKDFVQDIDALIDDKIISHYTGTIVIYQPSKKPTENYGTKRLEIVDVVDGQQRLTTCSLYLSIIIKELIKISQEDFNAEIPIYLYSGSKSKLRLNNDTADFYLDLISKGVSNIEANSVHQKRIYDAYCFLKKHIEEQLTKRVDKGEDYLRDLFDAIIRKLNFSFYPIEVESEIGMTFELMNSRGKNLSSMELLKNYLMYWVYRNILDNSEKEDFTSKINKTWKEVYVNIAKCNGSESQCLRIAWTLFVNYTPKNWNGYSGFKSDEVIPLRNFNSKSKEDVKEFLLKFVDGLALISKHYSAIIKPNNNSFDENELNLLTKIRNAGNIANYLPLMVASRIKKETNEVTKDDYFDLLKSLEIFSYRVFLWEGKRSNAGLSKFYRWADDVFSSKHSLKSVTDWIYGTINWYSPENGFRKSLTEDFFGWYHYRRLLKYTLFEYELFLLKGKNKPKLNWEDLTDSTIEHILPQNPDSNSNWLIKWTDEERKKYLHDISNLVLTKDNSRYSNFEFDRKKGIAGSGFSYSNSDIRQERKIAEYDDWTPDTCKKRREELTNWVIKNWGIDKHYQEPIVDVIEEDDEPIFNDVD